MTNEHEPTSGRRDDDTELVMRWVRLPLVDATDLVWLRPVRPGEPALIVAALRQARQMAEQLRVTLAEVGVISDDVQVEPGLNDAGAPVLRVALTPVGARRFARLLAAMGGAGPPPPDAGGSGGGVPGSQVA